jgi:hypothetical protein
VAGFSSEHEAQPKFWLGLPSGATIDGIIVSLCFPSVCHDRFNYWLDSPIDLHCRISDLFESIDRLFDIAALLSFSFRVFAFHFSSILLCWHGADFHPFFTHFFAFFPAQRGVAWIAKLVETRAAAELYISSAHLIPAELG